MKLNLQKTTATPSPLPRSSNGTAAAVKPSTAPIVCAANGISTKAAGRGTRKLSGNTSHIPTKPACSTAASSPFTTPCLNFPRNDLMLYGSIDWQQRKTKDPVDSYRQISARLGAAKIFEAGFDASISATFGIRSHREENAVPRTTPPRQRANLPSQHRRGPLEIRRTQARPQLQTPPRPRQHRLAVQLQTKRSRFVAGQIVLTQEAETQRSSEIQFSDDLFTF